MDDPYGRTVSILAAAFVLVVTAAFAAYYYSNMQADLTHRARTTTEFFANYIGQSYNEYYQSCISYARNYEDKNTHRAAIYQRQRPDCGLLLRPVGRQRPGHVGRGRRHFYPASLGVCGPGPGHRGADHGGVQPHDLHQRRGHRRAAPCDQYAGGGSAAGSGCPDGPGGRVPLRSGGGHEQQFLYPLYSGAGGGDHRHRQAHCRRQLRRANQGQVRR